MQVDPARMLLISGFVDTYLRLNPQEEQVFQMEIGKLELSERAGVMEIVTSWIEQGIEQGERSLVLRLLTRRVGTVSDLARSQIAALLIAQIAALGEALLDFSDLSDLETWLSCVTVN